MSTDYHGRGEQDARDGRDEKPHGFFDELTTWSKEGQEQNERDNEAYEAGHNHGQGQQDAGDGKYEKPHGFFDELTTWSEEGRAKNERDNEAYDAGHDSTSSQKSGGCFLTTACVEAAGLPDNCKELTVLRQFRDEFIAKLPDGPALIRDYYTMAPGIIARINTAPSKADILAGILVDVRKAVGLIEKGKNGAALNLYRRMTERVSANVDTSN